MQVKDNVDLFYICIYIYVYIYTYIYYIKTSEIPSEIFRENSISSHVKITCYLHT